MRTMDRSDTGEPRRRSFLKQLAGLGGAVAGLAGLGTAAEPQPRPQIGTRRTITVRPPMGEQILAVVKVQKGSPAAPPTLEPTTTAPTLLPRDRARVLATIGELPGGDQVLRSLSLQARGLAAKTDASGPVAAWGQSNLLALAYSQVVRVTPTRCEYADDAALERVPVFYYSDHGRLSFAALQNQRCSMSAGGVPPDEEILSFGMRMPGATDEYRTYSLELKMSEVNLSDVSLVLNGTGLDFLQTASGSWFCAASIPGSGPGGGTHLNHLYMYVTNRCNPIFEWLEITAL